MGFERFFREVNPGGIFDHGNIFKLVGEDFFLITAGKMGRHNSMVGSGGGMGMLFRKPVVWCVIRSDRYTLELMEKEGTYTLSFFPERYRAPMLLLGGKSGRDSAKMEETELTAVRMPSGNVAFEEARLIIECRLMQATMPDMDDFYTSEARDYIKETYKHPSDHRKYVFGDITRVWQKNGDLG